ncbi:hypothetical protein [Streptomyces sp. NPDC003090]|uniref:hypothetical protein n=1 Tax=Streptomyces sp. NPDC003090 TaxID=3154274 RepID=UPI0037F7AEAD
MSLNDTPSPARPAEPAHPVRPVSARALRGISLACALGLPPVWLAAWLVPLAGEVGSRCVTYGGDCGTKWPEGTPQFCFAAVAVACCVALFTPDRGRRTALVRRAALYAQLAFSTAAVLWVLTWATA